MQNDFLRVVGVILLGLLILIGGFAAIHLISISPLWGDAGAAWVQAIGATAGIGLAVWLPYQQSRQVAIAEVERRRDDVRRLHMAFRDELSALQRNFGGTNVRFLLALPPGGIFNRRIPVPTNRFPIFDRMVGRLTEIDDDAIRQGIIDAYEAANATMEAGLLNNDLLTAYKTLAHDAHYVADPYSKTELAFAEKGLAASAKQMRDMMKRTIEKVENVLPLLDAAVV